MAATRDDAYRAFDRFITTREARYPKAVETLKKDRDSLLAFYDFPPSTGSTFAQPTPSSRRLPPCVIAPAARAIASHAARFWDWQSR